MEKTYHIAITSKVIQLSEIMQYLNDPSHGAQVLFFGVVRNLNVGRSVLAVEYDVHPLLAESAMSKICEDAIQKWDKIKIVLIHRVGRLAVGEASVAIAVTSPHRREAYEASRYLIDHLKHQAPIWKKEFYETGESEWLEGHALCDAH